VRTELAGATPICAPSDFLEIVLPLVRNAFEASPAGERVEVELTERDRKLEVSVRDRGHGMDRETLERAGEPFFTTRAPGYGTGLGLFVVSLHVERLGGSLRLSSSPGRGTTAIVEWPRSGSEIAREPVESRLAS
jgi:two-component system sensor histidine kinase RegB